MQSTATIVPSLPSGVQSNNTSCMMKWVKGKGSKYQRKFDRLDRRNLAGRDECREEAARQEERLANERHANLKDFMLNCKAELSGAKVGGAGSNCRAIRLHASAQSPSCFPTAPQACARVPAIHGASRGSPKLQVLRYPAGHGNWHIGPLLQQSKGLHWCGEDEEGPGCQLHAAGPDHEGGVQL